MIGIIPVGMGLNPTMMMGVKKPEDIKTPTGVPGVGIFLFKFSWNT